MTCIGTTVKPIFHQAYFGRVGPDVLRCGHFKYFFFTKKILHFKKVFP